MTKFLIIGGSDAGISAGIRAKEVDPSIEVTLLGADEYPNFSICGIPFFIGGEVTHWKNLAHRTADDIRALGIDLKTGYRATAIDTKTSTVTAVDSAGKSHRFAYDRLLIGTGAISARPPVDGLDLPGVFFVRWMDQCLELDRYLADTVAKRAVIVGGGYIGMEMAEALTRRGLSVIVAEYLDQVMPSVDPQLGAIAASELTGHGIDVRTGIAVRSIVQRDGSLAVEGSDGFDEAADVVIVVTGVKPETWLARDAGIKAGEFGAIRVNRNMETNLPGVYAAGDCVETRHRLLGDGAYLPLGTTAHHQGYIAGENAAGLVSEYAGTLGTQSVKLFDLVIARTGLRDSEASTAGMHPYTTSIEAFDHKQYYPTAYPLTIRLTGDRETGRLLGAQIAGRKGTEVSKRIDTVAASIYAGLNVRDLIDCDLSYTPPLSSPWDPVQMAAQAWIREVR